MPLREIVNAAAQDVVLGNDLLDVEGVLDPLHAVGGRAALDQSLGDRLARRSAQRRDQLVQDHRHVVVERRGVEMLGRRELPDLGPPAREQGVALFLDARGECVECVDGDLQTHQSVAAGSPGRVRQQLWRRRSA